MGNVNLPTPVAVAGGAICVLGGYLLGALTGPDTATRTTAVVDSYDPSFPALIERLPALLRGLLGQRTVPRL